MRTIHIIVTGLGLLFLGNWDRKKLVLVLVNRGQYLDIVVLILELEEIILVIDLVNTTWFSLVLNTKMN